MKRLLSVFAVTLAIVLSSFSTSKKATTSYSWFDQQTHELIAVTSSPDDNPTNCTTSGSNCVKVYEGDLTGQDEPASGEIEAFAFNN
jgi:ABC-type cobalt transport system substrate-binding protein